MEINWAERYLSRYKLEAERVSKWLGKAPPNRSMIERTLDLFETYLDARQRASVNSASDAALLTLIQDLYIYVQPNNDLNRMSYLWSEALQIAKQLPSTSVKVKAYFQLALIRNEQGDSKTAQALYEYLCDSDDFSHLSTYQQAEIIFQLGVCYVQQGYYPRATEVLEHCIAIATEHTHPYTKAFALNQLGNVAMSQEHFEQARYFYQQTLAILEVNQQEKDLACVAYNSLGRLWLIQQDFEQAIPLLEKSRLLWLRRQELGGIAKNAVNLAMAYIGKNNLREAELLLDEAWTIHKKNAHQRGLARCHYAFGLLEKKRGNRKAALAQWMQALEIYKTVPIPLYELQLLSLLLPNLLLALRLRDFLSTLIRLIRHLKRQNRSLFEMMRFMAKGVRIWVSQIRADLLVR